MTLNGRLHHITDSKMLVGIIIMLISAWASWSTTAIIRASEQRAQIRENVQRNATTNESIQKSLEDIKKTVDTLLQLELERVNAR